MNEIALRQSNEVAVRPSIPSDHEMMVYHTMAEQAVSSKMYKGIGDKAGVMMIMLSARELGIAPMMALNGGLNIINGKVEISARMMSALIRKAGHQIIVKESSDTHCFLVGKRSDTGESLSTCFSVADAQKAGLVKPGGGWVKFPKDMCFARALSRLARQLFSDVIGIGYVEGEIVASGEQRISDIDSLVHEEISCSLELPVENEQDSIDEFLAVDAFEESDKDLALQYLDEVKKHFSWTTKEAVYELLKDQKRLYLKFKGWKEKKLPIM